MNKQTLRKMDLITSILLLIISVAGCIMSVQLVVKTLQSGRQWFESAGLFPMLVTFFLGMCSISLFLTAKKDGAGFDFLTKEKVLALAGMKEFKTGSLVVGLFGLYIFIMMTPGRQYELATFFYLLVSMLVFQKRSKKSIIKSIVIAAVATAVLTFGFGQLAMVPLP